MIYSIIVKTDRPVKNQDLHRCLETTLERLLEAGASDKEIEYILFATRTPVLPPNEYIDLGHGYIIPGKLIGYDGESPYYSRWR